MKDGFLYYYLRSMRLYYCFITGTTTLAGVVLPHVLSCSELYWGWRDVVLIIIGFLAWGVNQIFSDWCDRREDCVNAPHRPMVTGKLPVKKALLLSGILMTLFALVSFLVSPWILVALGVGGMLNICYSLLKRVPVLNCLVYALSITCCFFYGVFGVIGTFPVGRDLYGFLSYAACLILPAHFLMCSFSYYKDKEGDRLAGIRTLQNLWSDSVTLPLHVLFGLAYLSLFLLNGMMDVQILFSVAISLVLLTLLTILLARKKYHIATCVNCMLCVSLLLATISLLKPWLVVLIPVFLIFIYLLFRWYPDEKE